GGNVTFGVSDMVTINGIMVSNADNEALGGVIHIIDDILLPGTTFDCTDSTTWYKTDDPSKTCDWVAAFVPERCDAKGFDKTDASYACPVACGTRCGDSASWVSSCYVRVRLRRCRPSFSWLSSHRRPPQFKNGDPSKDCAWVQNFPEQRCNVRGPDAVLASAECYATCALIL
ncbi:MAG: hypothetical protein AAGM22_06035, partial [Acidobacteriota bacterium]